jgi:hypothetical protein
MNTIRRRRTSGAADQAIDAVVPAKPVCDPT